MMNLSSDQSPIYPRIRTFAYLAQNGDRTFCASCKENNAICPDCDSEVCVFCDAECSECGTPMF